MNRSNSFLGVILVLIGGLFLVSRFVFGMEFLHFSGDDFWPLIVLGVGLMFEVGYFASGRNPGLLVPGGIITTIGLLFFFEVATDWRLAEYTWPVYILSVAIGLFQLYVFGGKEKGVLIATSILTAIAVISFACMFLAVFLEVVDVGLVIPIVLIAVGLLIIFGRSVSSRNW